MQRIAAALVVCILLSWTLAARQKPDFSGTWSLPPDAPVGASGKPAPAPGFGPTINIRQDASTITISKIVNGQPLHVVHPLDGSESRTPAPSGLCRGEAQSFWTASWQDTALVTAMTGMLSAGATTPTKSAVKATFKLQSPDTLAVELAFPVQNQAEPRLVTTIYKKTGPPSEVPAAPAAAAVQTKISALNWLGGTWIGTTGTSEFEERWTPPAGGAMLSVARSLRNGVMSSFEFLCIVERNGGLVYQAMPNGRQPATDFALTKLEGTSATFENPTHDFPKKIQYTLGADGTLEAVISGTEKQKPQTFKFKKQG